MEIHTTGYAWKYIRASMTLTGFLPPMTDEEGNMLVDGGYMDNLTVLSPLVWKLTFRSLR
jgi:lysophospholipid hydrolase